MKDSFLKKIKIGLIGVMAVCGLLTVSKVAGAQTECIDCSFSCFDLCYSKYKDVNTELFCCDHQCTSVREYCDFQCACGDGKVGACETCDDGNLTDGDGCSSSCQSEQPVSDAPPPDPVPLYYKGVPYYASGWADLYFKVVADMNISSSDHVEPAVKGPTTATATTTPNLKISVMGSEALAQLHADYMYRLANNLTLPATTSTAFAAYPGCTQPKNMVWFGSASKGCLETSKAEWTAAGCPASAGCCLEPGKTFETASSTYTCQCLPGMACWTGTNTTTNRGDGYY